MANTIGNVEEYSIISINPATSETTTFQLNKNFTLNSNATFEKVKTASESITNLTTATYSDTILKTNISVQDHLNETVPDYSHFPEITFSASVVKVSSSANGYWGNVRIEIPTDFTENNLPEIKGVTIYHSQAATSDLICGISKTYTKAMATGIYFFNLYLGFTYTTARTLNNIKAYVTLDNTTYTFTINLEIRA